MPIMFGLQMFVYVIRHFEISLIMFSILYVHLLDRINDNRKSFTKTVFVRPILDTSHL